MIPVASRDEKPPKPLPRISPATWLALPNLSHLLNAAALVMLRTRAMPG